jgi:hypothetical protein
MMLMTTSFGPCLSTSKKWILPVIFSALLLNSRPLEGASALAVEIKTPLNGSTLSGNVSVTASPVSATSVQFYADGVSMGPAIITPPYTLIWNSRLVSDGMHALYAVARDAVGNHVTATVWVFVANAAPPVSSITLGPSTVSLTANQNQQFTAIVTGTSNTGVSWSISPALGTISSGGLYTAPATINSAQSVTVTATSLADATRTATALISLTAPALLTDTTSPVITLTAPANGATVNGTVSVSATASDQMGVAGVQFFVDGTPLGSEVAAAPYTVNWNTSSIPDGTHSLSAVARDAAGNRTTAAISVLVNNAPAPGVSTALKPDKAVLAASQTQQFTATFSGLANTGASWSISPKLGSISASGLYTAPATITRTRTVTVTAVSSADATKIATAVIALTAGVSITLGPTSVSLAASQIQQFTAAVAGSSNLGVSWSISPQLGIISSGGLYTAPATISTAQNVTVTATSLADTTKTATALVALKSIGSAAVVSITLGPGNTSLSASQTQQFTAAVTGSSNTSVSWSISPQMGTISATGLYTAPVMNTSLSSFIAQPVVTVTATSLADPTKTATATVALTPVLSVTVGPVSASLTPSQTQQFTATVAGTSNTGVSWSINPPLGSISSGGLYTAPSTITSTQNVMLTATSLADTTKTAVAVIALALSPAPLTISITTPANASTVSGNVGISATAGPGGTVAGVQFYADSSPVGALVTTAPYTVNWNSSKVPDGAHTLSAMAQDLGGNKSTATVSVSVSNTPTVSAVTLPVEVMGADGMTQTTQVNVPSVPAGTLRLWLQIHGLKYQTQASVQVNNSAWLPINDTTVTLLGLASSYGGIGGGFSTLKLTMTLPAGAVVAGTNTVRFRFNGTDGVTSGFRVLNFNFVAPDGTAVVSSAGFVQDDPGTWQPPSTLASDISAGQTLWLTASLTTAAGPIRAKCADCHAQDGRDLKYFNYSNYSIRVRSMFHGLSAQQGDQIASYIRSLNAPAPTTARPWNPPYQPGSGLDSKPVSEWAAGAGLDSVLDHDADTVTYLAPGGNTTNWPSPANLNARETPITLQLPDWNHWLPRVHPMDAWSDFANSKFAAYYPLIRSNLKFQDAVAYQNSKDLLTQWYARWTELMWPKILPQYNPVWTADYTTAVYSTALWKGVKLWEMMQEFGLEGLNQVAFGPQGEPRGWYSVWPFFISPNMQHIPRGSPGLGNGSVGTHIYLSYSWYHLQLLLNNGNRRQAGTSPIDYGYIYGFVKDLSNFDSNAQAGLQLLWLVKALQGSDGGAGPETGITGWHPMNNDPSRLVHQAWSNIWIETPAATRAALSEAYLRAWFGKISSFTPQQFYLGGFADPSVIPVPNAMDGNFGDRVWFMLPQFRYFGVSSTLTGQIADWAKTIWPGANWDLTKTATCITLGNESVCSTQKAP